MTGTGRNRAPRGTETLRWLIAATPVLPVAVLFAWHPRTWLESAEPGEVDPALVAVIAGVVVAWLVGTALARVDSRRARDTPGPNWQWALLGAPAFLGALAKTDAGHRALVPAVASGAVVLLGVIVAVQKLIDAAP